MQSPGPSPSEAGADRIPSSAGPWLAGPWWAAVNIRVPVPQVSLLAPTSCGEWECGLSVFSMLALPMSLGAEFKETEGWISGQSLP